MCLANGASLFIYQPEDLSTTVPPSSVCRSLFRISMVLLSLRLFLAQATRYGRAILFGVIASAICLVDGIESLRMLAVLAIGLDYSLLFEAVSYFGDDIVRLCLLIDHGCVLAFRHISINGGHRC
jgi:hypothetical protein